LLVASHTSHHELPATVLRWCARERRGGNRQANTALYRIVVVRLRWHQPTRDYLTRRTKEVERSGQLPGVVGVNHL
jgi:hypothetical protein